MPYQRLLDELVRVVPGAQAALLLDSEGEVVVQAGERDYRARLIGAYQGIALATAQRTSERYSSGPVEYMLCRYDSASVILRPLRDGYYVVLSLTVEASTAVGLHRADEIGARLAEQI